MKKFILYLIILLLNIQIISANEITEAPIETTNEPIIEETIVPSEEIVIEETTSPTQIPLETIVPVTTDEPITTSAPIENKEEVIPEISSGAIIIDDYNDEELLPGTYEYDDMKYTIIDYQNALSPISLLSNDSLNLKREKRIARYENIKQGGYEYISKFMINGKVGYCIEPYVMVILDNEGNGPQYTIQPSDLNPEILNKVGRIIHYGYGHPLIGNSDESYLATQLLIWQTICPQEYQEIITSLMWCSPADQQCPAVSGNVDVNNMMNEIMNLVENYDTAPSFASQWHDTITYELDWDETLILTDDGSTNLFHKGSPVLDWFEPFPQESHSGINIKQEGNLLKIDIDDLYYEGYDSANGKTLTFKRKDQDYQSWLNNILLYTSGSNQKLMGISFENPTPSYTLAFKLKTADIEIEKLDEYFKSQNFSEGTQFVIGWYDDPTYQYRYDGGKDENWQDLYNFNVGIDPDLYGSFNYVNGNKTYYPIMTLDGTNIRTFTIGADGLAHISDLLPRHKSWWIKEWKVTNPYLIDERPFLVKTNDQNETTHQDFVNMLRDIDLSIVKQDSDNIYLKLNGANFEIYQINDFDLTKDPTPLGNITTDYLEPSTKISYQQLINNLNDPQVGQSFFLNGYRYTIQKIENDGYLLSSIKYDDFNSIEPITYDQIPKVLKEFNKFSITNNENTKEYQLIQYTKDGAIIKYTDLSTTLTLDNVEAIIIQDHLEYENKAYTIKEKIDDDSYIVYPATLYHIPNVSLTYNQLPENIKNHQETKFSIDNINYEVISYNPHKMHLKAYENYKLLINEDSKELKLKDIEQWLQDNNEYTLENIPIDTIININGINYQLTNKIYENDSIIGLEVQRIQETSLTIDVPPIISIEDIPKTISANESFTILDIIEPVYYVKDDQNNNYKITKEGNYYLNDENNYVKTNDNSIIDYAHLTNILNDDKNIYCNDPYDISACPIGTTRTYSYEKIMEQPYEYAQFNDLYQAAINQGTSLEQVSANEMITINDIEYTIIEPLDPQNPTYIKIQVKINDKNINLVLYKDLPTTTYQYKEQITKTFTISNFDSKEYIVKWNTSSFNEHLTHPDIVFHLKANQNLQYALDFTYDDIPNIQDLKVNDTFTINEHTYIVCSNYPELSNIVIKDENEKMFFLSPQAISSYDIINYEKVKQLEINNQMPFKINDKFTLPYQRELIKGDDITINNKKYTLLSKSDDFEYVFGFALEDDAPFTYQQILDMFKTHSTIQIDTNTYILKKDNINDEEVTIVQDQNGHQYHYYRYHLQASNAENIPEHQSFWIYKPANITYQDILKIFAYKLPPLNTKFIYNDTTYELMAINEKSLTLKDLNTSKNTIANYEDNNDHLTLDKYFININKTYDINDIYTKENEHFYLTSDDSNILIDGHIFKVESMKNFDIKIHYGKQDDGLSYEIVKEILQKEPQINDTFTHNDKKYTIKDIIINDDIKESLVITRANILDPNKTNTYYLDIPVPITKKDIPPIHSDLHDTFTINGITYTIEKIIMHDDNTKDFKVSFIDENNNKNYYLLTNEQLSTDIRKDSIMQAFNFTTTNENLTNIKKVETLPLFKGETGKNQLRISDPFNHNSSVSFYPVIISKDPDGMEIVKSGLSDYWGMFEVDDLEPGTYFYNQPNTRIMQEFVVFEHNQIDGQLNVNNLKWGKQYMACETKLPLGYDYASSDVENAKDICFVFDSEYDNDIDITYENVLNTKRKLDLEVIKVDHDNQSMLLNGAIFTISDVTNLNHDASLDDISTFIHKIKFKDIPTNIKINEKFDIWQDDLNYQYTYKIMEINDEYIKVKRLDDNMTFHVDKKQINVNVPLTYQDILKNVSTLDIGMQFKAYGKQQGNIQTYQVIDIIYANDATIWSPTETEDVSANSILSYKLINTNDNNQQVIEVKNDNIIIPEIISEQYIGTYVSGGIYRKLTTNQAIEPFIYNDIISAITNLKENEKFTLNTLDTILAPKYHDIDQNLKINDSFKFNNVNFNLISMDKSQAILSYIGKDNLTNKLILNKDKNNDIYIQAMIQDNYQILEIMSDYRGIRYEDIENIQEIKTNDIIYFNNLSYKVVENDLVNKIIKLQNASSQIDDEIIYEGLIETFYPNQDFNEKILSMTIKNLRTNKDYYVYDGQTYTYHDIPAIGEYYYVTDKQDKKVLEGYTNKQGEIIIYGINEGEYKLHYRDANEEFIIKHGSITLNNIDYGTELKICEIQSPLGYIIGDACEVIKIENDNDSLVKNYKTNKKLIVKKKIVRIRKMGQD